VTRTVRVHPSTALAARSRLFAALAEAFDVTFEPTPERAGGADPVIAFEGEVHPDARSYVVCGQSQAGVGEVAFETTPLLDARLRGRRLAERAAAGSGVAERAGDTVLARINGRPVWVKRADADLVTSAPDELAEGEYLRDRLDPGRFIELLPLVHWLREVTAEDAWASPPVQASFVVDDPNLHWRSYGYLRYDELVGDARRHGYHLSVAMVPIDGWYAHGPTVELFRASTDALSLCIHGNDHRLHELGRPATPTEARPIVAQAIRRTAAFERRTGLSVSRVMVPPFESCSAATTEVLLEFGFEGLSQTRPHVWMPLERERSPYASTDPDRTLSGWYMAELMDDGLPVMIRREFQEHDAIVLRAFLDQPVVLYGHVEDFAGGLDPLSDAASVINSLPEVEWGSLADVAARSYQRRQRGDVLELRPFARRIRVEVGPDVRALLVAPARPAGFERGFSVRSELGTQAADALSVVLPPGREQQLTCELSFDAATRRDSLGQSPAATVALMRRALVEARDRGRAVARR
jgi:hypothetical protein